MKSPSIVREQVSVAAVIAPLVERWRSLLGWLVAAWVVTGGVVLIPGRAYEARVQVAAISNSRVPSLSALGGAASLLGGALGGLQATGLQVTPALVRSLMLSDAVLIAAGKARVDSHPGRLVDRASGSTVPDERIGRVMGKLLETGVSTETGIITLRVSLQDSALARALVERVLAETRAAYVGIVRSQASLQRQGQQTRVDSASSQLAASERALADFEGSNRSLTSYSQKVVERQALERRVQISQQVYLQAVTDREAAIARELEATPVLAVVDRVPDVLPPARRYLLVKLVLASATVGLVWSLVILMRDGYRRQDPNDPDILRLHQAVSSLPSVHLGRRQTPPA